MLVVDLENVLHGNLVQSVPVDMPTLALAWSGKCQSTARGMLRGAPGQIMRYIVPVPARVHVMGTQTSMIVKASALEHCMGITYKPQTLPGSDIVKGLSRTLSTMDS